MYPTNKSSALVKGTVPPPETLLVCYWSVAEHCCQNLFLTNCSSFAQNVIHALTTPSLDYCRSFFYSRPKSLPSKLQGGWLVSYSREQSYHLALPSFSWLTYFLLLNLSQNCPLDFRKVHGLTAADHCSLVFAHFTVPPLYPPSLSLLHVFLSEKLYCHMFGSFLFISQLCVKKLFILQLTLAIKFPIVNCLKML